MPLTDTLVRLAKPAAKNYTLKDTDGLALFVSVNGMKSWHFRFCWAERQPRISLGTYPEVVSGKPAAYCLLNQVQVGA